MPIWKLTIFVSAVKARIKLENRTADDIIEEYTKLTNDEKEEILSNISQ